MNILRDSIIKPLPDDATIEKNEAWWRVELPVDYREFVKNFGGCIPHDKAFTAKNHEYAVDRFLCILNDARSNDLGWYDISVVFGQVEDRLLDDNIEYGTDVLPIAALFAGDLLCLNYKDNNDDPTVCVWDYDASDEGEPVLYPVADSFTEFLNMLY
jgi:hypothetical protein